MKTFKRIDLAVQITLIVTIAITTLIVGLKTLLNAFIIIGLWQLTGMLIHFINKWHLTKGSRRYNFQLLVIALAAIVCLMPLIPVLYILLYFAVFIIPVLIIIYLWICFMEVFHYVKRPLELI